MTMYKRIINKKSAVKCKYNDGKTILPVDLLKIRWQE